MFFTDNCCKEYNVICSTWEHLRLRMRVDTKSASTDGRIDGVTPESGNDTSPNLAENDRKTETKQ